MTVGLGVILAGGLATRMGGGDKGLTPIGGQTILSRVVARIDPQVDDLVINANGDPTRFQDLGLPVVADSVPDNPGPLAGVLAGMDWGLANGATHIVTVAADTPFFPADLVARLEDATRADGKPIALAATEDGRHPTFGLWPTALADDLRAALNDGMRRVVTWADGHGTATALFDNPNAFFNVNAPGDIARAQELAK